MCNHNLHCLLSTKFKDTRDAIHHLKDIPGVILDMRNLAGDDIHTCFVRVVVNNRVVTKYAVQDRGLHTVIHTSPICGHHLDELPDGLLDTLQSIHESIISNKVGQIFGIGWEDYNRMDRVLELVYFFPEHSKQYRYILLRHGDVVVNLCDKVTPLYTLGELWYDFRYMVIFDVPDDVNKILTDRYGISLEREINRLDEASIRYYKHKETL